MMNAMFFPLSNNYNCILFLDNTAVLDVGSGVLHPCSSLQGVKFTNGGRRVNVTSDTTNTFKNQEAYGHTWKHKVNKIIAP